MYSTTILTGAGYDAPQVVRVALRGLLHLDHGAAAVLLVDKAASGSVRRLQGRGVDALGHDLIFTFILFMQHLVLLFLQFRDAHADVPVDELSLLEHDLALLRRRLSVCVCYDIVLLLGVPLSGPELISGASIVGRLT